VNNFEIIKHKFDVIIIGAGGAGLRAAISCFDEGIRNIAIVSKVIPSLSHTVAAKGGINAALGNEKEDNWRWHAYDTIKAGDYIADHDAVEIMCENAAENIVELEKMGVIFSRNNQGKIAQRAYGGQMTDYGEGVIASRACYSKDNTGHTILHTLHQQAMKRDIKFFNEFFVTDLLIDSQNSSSKECYGATAIDLNLGNLVAFEAKFTILATGGHSQIYLNTTSSSICTGDGGGLVLRAGLALQDMEFVQFHPTGIYGCGFLISEATRGEGAYLFNGNGERFMQNYAPKMMELASRDVIARAMSQEIIENKGCGKDKAWLNLSLRHLSPDIILEKLPGTIEMARNFARVDVFKEDIPVVPSVHYVMGGIATNLKTIVTYIENNLEKEVAGLMAIGEAACVSVHGANRLGCNSLLDIVVFGKLAGKIAAKKIKNQDFAQNNHKIDEITKTKIQRLSDLLNKVADTSEVKISLVNISLAEIKNNLQHNNEINLGVFRNESLINSALQNINKLFTQFKNFSFKNKSLIWNEDLVNYLELENLFLNSYATAYSALQRKESRGAHFRSDYTARDDQNWRCHSLVTIKNFNSKIKLPELEFFTKDIRHQSKIAELNVNPQTRNY
jgi:succinate dehydrogenase / fumarate reductase flavoprotein subunit